MKSHDRRISPAAADFPRPPGICALVCALHVLDQEFGDLDRVQGSALAEVIAGNHEDQALVVVNGLVLADAPHQGVVLAGGGQRAGRSDARPEHTGM